jgi:Mn-dependent DtxR family transcriptional regulator
MIMTVMKMTIHKSAEDYLETMLMLKEERGYIRSVDVADKLGVTKPSVSYVTKRLRENGYITTDPAGMIVLLGPGLEIAERMYERHKLLTELLTGLGVSPETAREDACKIEHDLSVESFDAIRRHAQKYR